MGLILAVLKLVLPLANNDTLKTMVLVVALFIGGYALIGVLQSRAVKEIQAGAQEIAELRVQHEKVLSAINSVNHTVEGLRKDVADTKEVASRTDKRLWEYMIQQRIGSPRKAVHTF